MENYPNNSRNKAKKAPPEKKIEKVVQGTVVKRKVPLRKKFRETFFPGSPKDVWEGVSRSVVVPAVKDLIWEVGSESLSRALSREDYSRRRSSSSSVGRIVGDAIGQVQYNRYSSGGVGPSGPARRDISRQGRARHDFGEIILETRAEGDAVINHLYRVVDQYEFATVKDLYEMLDIKSTYTDEKWGWTSMAGSDVRRLSDGTYLLELPRPEPID